MARGTWYRLDNIGKFYSSQAGRSLQTVFRYSAALRDPINPEVLQRALDRTLAQFPSFQVCLRSGLFWHYLEQSEQRVLVQEEHLPICSRLHTEHDSVLFRVTYFRNRITVEMSHMVSDGRGTLALLRALVREYVCERYAIVGVTSTYTGSDWDKSENSFDKYYEKDKAKTAPGTKIFRIPGPQDRSAPTFMELHVDAPTVLARARACGASLTSYLIAAIVRAIAELMPLRQRSKQIRVDIPVDLRQFYGSQTVRNFYGMTYVTYCPATRTATADEGKPVLDDMDDADEPVSLAYLANIVQQQLTSATSRERMAASMNGMIKLEKNPLLRVAPMHVKDLALVAAQYVTERSTTTTLSNVGRVMFDPRIAPYVQSVSMLTTPAGLNFTVCSCGDDLCIGISTIYRNLEVTKHLVRLLAEEGIEGTMDITGALVPETHAAPSRAAHNAAPSTRAERRAAKRKAKKSRKSRK